MLLTLFKNLHIGMRLDAYELSWFKLGIMIDNIECHILIPVCWTLIYIQGHMCKKTGTSAPIVSIFFPLWMELGVLLRLVGLMNLTIILSGPISVQGREPFLCDFISKILLLACIQIFTDQFLSNLAW